MLLFFHDLHTEKKQVVKNTIKIQRATNDLTQESLANKIGVSRQTINSIEKNEFRFESTILQKLKISIYNHEN
mgnify:CR=1 FL=1